MSFYDETTRGASGLYLRLYYQYSTKSNSVSDVTLSDSKYQKAVKIWKKLPVGITKIAGPQLRKYIP